MESIADTKHYTGARQSARAIREGKALRAFVASDAKADVTLPIRRLCEEKSIPVTAVESMGELGAACGIEIGAAVAVILA
ncbi:MAG: ribosomal L7Ae/L30e/S12e/Gadd45 family protein [Oscillospiraceae bacterium]|nr:ribosomal L7Ae/L30e/S12e/Gadd45 family protein [Oscillospiraceae bacterium]